MRKREKRIRTAGHHLGTTHASHGWAARQASRRRGRRRKSKKSGYKM